MFPIPIQRRGFMQVGALALGGLTLPRILAAQSASGTQRPPHSVIMLYQHGGASQLETWDLKPEAPLSYRSVFRPISTSVPGMEICEHFPLQAAQAHRFSLVRSLHHDVGIHSDGGIVALTGKRPTVLDPTSQSKSEHPDFGSVASFVKGYGSPPLPPYVTIPRHPYMTRPAYLGLHHAGLDTGDPNSTAYQPPQAKLIAGRDGDFLNRRRNLLQQFDRLRSSLDVTGQMEGVDRFRDR